MYLRFELDLNYNSSKFNNYENMGTQCKFILLDLNDFFLNHSKNKLPLTFIIYIFYVALWLIGFNWN